MIDSSKSRTATTIQWPLTDSQLTRSETRRRASDFPAHRQLRASRRDRRASRTASDEKQSRAITSGPPDAHRWFVADAVVPGEAARRGKQSCRTGWLVAPRPADDVTTLSGDLAVIQDEDRDGPLAAELLDLPRGRAHMRARSKASGARP
jgi:hypothetical protein